MCIILIQLLSENECDAHIIIVDIALMSNNKSIWPVEEVTYISPFKAIRKSDVLSKITWISLIFAHRKNGQLLIPLIELFVKVTFKYLSLLMMYFIISFFLQKLLLVLIFVAGTQSAPGPQNTFVSTLTN